MSRNGIEDNELLFEEFFGEDDYFCVTDRILMREMNENDFDDYLLVMKDLTPKVMQTGDMKQYFMKGARESFQSIDTEDTLLIGIWERNEFDFCGYCMLKNIQSNTPEIGIDLRRKYRRKHIGHEALSKMIDIARELFEIDHFIYAVDVENTASQKLAEELGGVRRETKNTLSEKIVEMLKETQVAQEPELFQHYEYWI